ncbi:MAG: hypothetical protein V2A73_01640 [Pseudomonadota bacterium]
MPDWAVGKTAAEVLGLAKQQNDIISSMPAYQPPRNEPVSEKPWQTAPPGLPTDDDWTATPSKAASAFEKVMAANLEARYTPMLEGMAQSVAQGARAQAQMLFSKEFGKYGPEIDNEIAKVSIAQRTPDLYRYAVEIVRGRHIEELAEERVRERMANLPAAERAMGGAMGAAQTGLVDWDKLPPVIKDKWQRAGITEATIREDCAKWGMTPARFLEMTMADQVISETPDGGWQVGRDALKIPGGFR